MKLYRYNPSTKCLDEQPRMREPTDKGYYLTDGAGVKHFNRAGFAVATRGYRNHVTSLQSFPVAEGSVWPEGDIDETMFEIQRTFITTITGQRLSDTDCAYPKNPIGAGGESLLAKDLIESWDKQDPLDVPRFTARDMIECWAKARTGMLQDFDEHAISRNEYFTSKGIENGNSTVDA